jgi:hypothetical protein
MHFCAYAPIAALMNLLPGHHGLSAKAMRHIAILLPLIKTNDAPAPEGR